MRPQHNEPANGPKTPEAPAQPSAFEQVVFELRLTPAQYESSAELKRWVQQYKDQKYVPVDLLKAWGYKVRADV
jgi:hypothetical protein